MAHNIAVIGGDGIGPEVTEVALEMIECVDVATDVTRFDLGGSRYLRDGTVLDDDTLDELRGFDAILLGAVGTPDVPPGVIERGLLLRARFELDLFVNLRPFKLSRSQGANAPIASAPTASAPIASAPTASAPIEGPIEGHEFTIIRENTEGTYAGEGGFLRKGTPHEIATQGSVNTRMGAERAIRFGFELALSKANPHLVLVHKTNVLTFSGDLWERTFNEVAAEFDGVATDYQHVDAACIHMVEHPERYEVIVTDNLFGDILTDLAGAVAGGIGLAPSANLNPARTGPSLFEPVHGSAPDIAGQGLANPTAAVLSAALMLEFLGEVTAAAQLRAACDAVTADPEVADIGTEQIATAIRKHLLTG